MARRNLPGYLKHKTTGQAFCVIHGKFIYLGKYKSKASREEYEKIISEYLANGRKLPPTRIQQTISVAELVVGFLEHAETYYVQDGKRTNSFNHCQNALAPLVKHYGRKSVSEFGPLSLKFIREKWIAAGHARSTIHKRVSAIRQAFKWGVENEMVSPDVLTALQAVKGLKRGRSQAKETEEIEPVERETVEKTLPFLPPIIADMVRVHRFAGMRSQDVLNLRGCDVKRVGNVWKYSPVTHKNKHRNQTRDLALGPRAQAILMPYLLEKADTPETFLFSPKDSERLRRAELRKNRKTKVQPSQVNRKKTEPKRSPRDQYTNYSYNRAIIRACEKAGIDAWHPNQLRHSAATEIRELYGPDFAQAVLGHANMKTTEIYAKVSFEKAAKVMLEIG